MTKRRIIFMGTPAFAVASLDALMEAGADIAAVVTAPDKPAGRGQQMRMSAVKERSIELGLPVLQPARLKDEVFLRALDALGADLYVVVAFRMLPAEVWARPTLGTINLHASLLPQYRGAAPINWAIIHGDRTTGATTFFIRHEIDTGDIIERVEVPVGPDTTAGELHDLLMKEGARLLVRTVSAVLEGSATSHPQLVAHDEALHHAPKLTPANCRIDWSLPAARVHDLIRGLSPYPGAWTELRAGSRAPMHFKVLRTRRSADAPLAPACGELLIAGDRIWAGCGDCSVELLEVQPEGKRRMSAGEFARGAAAWGPLSCA